VYSTRWSHRSLDWVLFLDGSYCICSSVTVIKCCVDLGKHKIREWAIRPRVKNRRIFSESTDLCLWIVYITVILVFLTIIVKRHRVPWACEVNIVWIKNIITLDLKVVVLLELRLDTNCWCRELLSLQHWWNIAIKVHRTHRFAVLYCINEFWNFGGLTNKFSVGRALNGLHFTAKRLQFFLLFFLDQNFVFEKRMVLHLLLSLDYLCVESTFWPVCS
jgi:hypothetical protein